MTLAQRDLLRFIEAYIRDHDGVSPNFDEMKIAVGLKSKSGVARVVELLERDGLIRRGALGPRNISVVESKPLASVSIGRDGAVSINIPRGLTSAQRDSVRAALAQAEARL